MPTAGEHNSVHTAVIYRYNRHLDGRYRKQENSLRLLQRAWETEINQSLIEYKNVGRQVEEVRNTLHMLGKVSSYTKVKAHKSNLAHVGDSRLAKSKVHVERDSSLPVARLGVTRTVGDNSNVQSEPTDLLLPIIEHRQAPMAYRGEKTTKLTLPPCLYTKERWKCNSFPCVQPQTYTSLGYRLLPSNNLYQIDITRRDQLHTPIWNTPQSDTWTRLRSIRRPLGSQAEDRIYSRELFLNHMFAERRKRYARLKIADQDTMYGQTLPIHKLRKLKTQRRLATL